MHQIVEECEMGEWSDWSNCTQPCGVGGERSRTRVAKPGIGGPECEFVPDEETHSCHTESCNEGEYFT